MSDELVELDKVRAKWCCGDACQNFGVYSLESSLVSWIRYSLFVGVRKGHRLYLGETFRHTAAAKRLAHQLQFLWGETMSEALKVKHSSNETFHTGFFRPFSEIIRRLPLITYPVLVSIGKSRLVWMYHLDHGSITCLVISLELPAALFWLEIFGTSHRRTMFQSQAFAT